MPGMPGQGLEKVPGRNEEEFRREAAALREELKVEVARLNAERDRSQAFIDGVEAAASKIGDISQRIEDFFHKVFK